MPGPHSPPGADMGQAAHPAADTILRVPQAAVIGVATVAMVMDGAVVQLVAFTFGRPFAQDSESYLEAALVGAAQANESLL